MISQIGHVGFFGEKPGFRAGEGSEKKGYFPYQPIIFMRWDYV